MRELIDLTKQLIDYRNEYWLHEVLFSFNWWFLLLLTVAPWIVWWKLVDKKYVIEYALYGCFISLSSILLDDIGSHFLLWIYQFQLVPISPRLNPIDLTVMPVTFMLVYQYFNKWKGFLLAQTILAGGAAFISEPLFTSMGIYKALHWEYVYSFFIYIALGIGTKILMGKLVALQKNAYK